ncbi:hypothetical protein B4U80_09055 [Leptotrombidium deliense]|uniref:Uncharacterized protein n=1 Tax=Leptotrombidium deliense TaxID=299467 RepID=A0A443SAY5_9ACAR|nr:hypothetical protein B4U80_09055 [Leptotrombidium deliense]
MASSHIFRTIRETKPKTVQHASRCLQTNNLNNKNGTKGIDREVVEEANIMVSFDTENLFPSYHKKDYCLNNSYFEFETKIYIQCTGLSKGSN